MSTKLAALQLHARMTTLPISSVFVPQAPDQGWSIVVAFHGDAGQRRAMEVCDNMVARFWPELEFQVHWCSFDQLAEAARAQEAAAHAAAAKIVIISTAAEAGLPEAVKAWMEQWAQQRHGREGALIGLVEGAPECPAHKCLEQHFRAMAHGAGMDYLAHEPVCAPAALPDDAGWFNTKACELGSVLGEMLDKQGQPPA